MEHHLLAGSRAPREVSLSQVTDHHVTVAGHFGQILKASRAQVVSDGYRRPAPDHEINEMAADEAGATGHQDATTLIPIEPAWSAAHQTPPRPHRHLR